MVFYHFTACHGMNVECVECWEDGCIEESWDQQTPEHRLCREKYRVTKQLCVNMPFYFNAGVEIHISHPCIPPSGYQHHCVGMTARCMKYEYNFYTLTTPPPPLFQLISLECFLLVRVVTCHVTNCHD